jgi:small-conductance mechanosensitive channel
MDWLETHQVTVGNTEVGYASLILATFVILAGFFFASRIGKRIRAFGGEKGPRWREVAAQAAGYLIRFITIAGALQLTGIDIASVLAASAVLAVGIGIAMQKVAENFVSGIILFAERSIREGDVIEFDGRLARVRHVGIRATIARTLDDEEIIVPNSMLAQSAVKNLTLSDSLHRLSVGIGVAYANDADHAVAVLHKAAEALTWRDPARDPVVMLVDFGDSSLDFEVSIWTRDVWAMRRGQSDLRLALWRALRDARIESPFPQLDVHLDRIPSKLTPPTSAPPTEAAPAP